MYVIILREVGLHWDRASDLLAYALGLLIIVCILTLVFANAGGGVAEWGKEATGIFLFCDERGGAGAGHLAGDCPLEQEAGGPSWLHLPAVREGPRRPGRTISKSPQQ